MSSAKDYVLDITPPSDDGTYQVSSAVKFTVRNKKSSIIIKYRLAIVSFLLVIEGILMSYVLNPERRRKLLAYMTDYMNWDTQTKVILGVNISILVLFLRQDPHDEMIVLKDTGIQLVSEGPWKYQTKLENFIPLNKIIDIVIHESFSGQASVIFYLCILLKPDPKNTNNEMIKVIFPRLLPRKNIVIQVWRLSKLALFGKTKQYWRRVPGQGLKQLDST